LIGQVIAAEQASAALKAVAQKIKDQEQKTGEGIEAMRTWVAELKKLIGDGSCCATCKGLLGVADYLIRKSVWAIGGDGWAYDIGYGGLDHVLASGRNIKILVLDTEVYSNTGGQASKSTPLGAIAKFAASGKTQMKKSLGLISMTYKNIYVAQVSLGANPAATVKAFAEAEAYDGPAIIIAYSHCIAQGFDLIAGLEHQKIAVETGHFPLYRYNPELATQGKNPLQLDSKAPTQSFAETALTENRFKQLLKLNPNANAMLQSAETKFRENFDMLQALANLPKS
jgi:pyruvate-ferredoxin/flavodoxin oxidoreductase